MWRGYSEARFQAEIIQAARLLGWMAYHTHDSRRSARGFPDLVLTNGRRVIFAELKREGGQPTAEQAIWLETLQRVAGYDGSRVETHLWRPSDWDVIERTLQEEA